MFKRPVARRGAAPMLLVSLGAATAMAALAGCAPGTDPSGSPTGTGPSASSSAAAARAGASAAASGPSSQPTQGSGGGNGSTGQGSDGGQGNGSGSGSSGSGSGNPPNCLLAQVSITTAPYLSPAGTGIAAEPIILKNTGSATCVVHGWPGVAALDGGGAQIYQAARIGAEGSAITLQPGGSASAVLYAVTSLGGPHHGGSNSCTQVPNLLVTPPNEVHSGQVAFGTPVCVTPALTALLPGNDAAVSAPAEYYEALQLWEVGATEASFKQGSYEVEAGNLLFNAVGAGVSGTSGFLTAANELTQLSALPDAMLNPTQQSEFDADTAALNTFFGTSGLYN